MMEIEKVTKFCISNTDDYVSVDSYGNVVLYVADEGEVNITANSHSLTPQYINALIEAPLGS